MAARLTLAVLVFTIAFACRPVQRSAPTVSEGQFSPPPPQIPRIVALGNLRSGRAPTRAEEELAVFLFGTEPSAPPALVKPSDLIARDHNLLICDGGLSAVVKWDCTARALSQTPIAHDLTNPVAIAEVPDGGWLVADAGAATVLRFRPDGSAATNYRLESDPFRPVGVACVGGEVWAANAAAHCIEVFELESGRHVRSFGTRGSGAGEFGLPLRMTTTNDGRVLVVDMLNGRVQVFDQTGQWIQDIGRPGDRVGSFGRPKDVAVGPDGVVFVTDAALQCVHAFDSAGRVLMAFGQPGSGTHALALPDGLCISMTPPSDLRPPAGFTADYYVLVAEQLNDPGIRVFAWGRGESQPLVQEAVASSKPPTAGHVASPHWSAESCHMCHGSEAGRPASIDARRVDALCLSCHNGTKALAEAHPIGRSVAAAGMTVPQGWPLVEGRTGCLTCHDILRHGDPAVKRPVVNAAFVREYEPDRQMAFCTKCHAASDDWRVSPHRQFTGAGQVDAHSCTFCHTSPPAVPPDGKRHFEPMLRIGTSQLCLTCHSRHWDVSPRGHVERPVTDIVLRTMLAGEGASDDPGRQPARLPLADGRVQCFTCHNPHQAGLFPPGSELGMRSEQPADAYASLRVRQADLCLSCHAK